MKHNEIILRNQAHPKLEAATTTSTNHGTSMLHVDTGPGFIQIGPGNSGHCHIQTDISNFYFNKELRVDSGVIGSYNEDLYLRRATNSSHQIQISTTSITNSLPTTVNGVVTWTGGNSTNANTAYGWGNHASVGYLTAVPAKASPVTSTELGAVNLDDYAQQDDAGFYHQLANSDATNGSNWPNNRAGSLLVQKGANHQGYGTTQLFIDYSSSDVYVRSMYGSTSANRAWVKLYDTSDFNNNSTNWNTAYGWGDHSTQGYITDGNTNWNNTYGFITNTSGTAKGGGQNYVASSTSTSNRGNYGAGVWAYSGYSTGSNRPFTYDVTLQVMYSASAGFEISADWIGQSSTPLKVRSLRDCCQGWSDYSTIWTSSTDGANSGLDADLLDGQHGSYYAPASHVHSYLPLTGGTLDNGTSTTLSVKCDNGGTALVRAGGDGQGTGVFEVTQDNGSHGGGMSYNGDGTPSWASGESADHVTFYRIQSGTRTEVFHYPYSSNVVNFNSTPTVGGNAVWHAGNDGSGSGLDADTVDNLQASQFLRSDTDDTVTAGTTYTFPASDSPAIISTRGNGGASLYVGGWSSGTNSNGIHRISSSSNLHIDSAADGNLYLNYYRGGTTYIGGANVAWHAGNDGTGSGLDADTVDGLDSSQFVRSDATDTFTNLVGQSLEFDKLVYDWTGGTKVPIIELKGATSYGWFYHEGSPDQMMFSTSGNTNYELAFSSSYITHKGNTIWHAGNDGTGSGLDADTVDGKQGADLFNFGYAYMSNSLSRAVGSGVQWYKVASFSGSVKHITMKVTSSGDNTTGTDTFFISCGSYGMKAQIVRMPSTKYNGTKLQEVRTKYVSGPTYEIWVKVGSITTSVGYLQVSMNDSGVTGTLSAGSEPSVGTADATLPITAQDRIDYSLQATSKIEAMSGFDVNGSTVWHAGNDGTGSGLDADTLDGVNSGSFLRSDTDDTFSGSYLTMGGDFKFTGNLYFMNTNDTSKTFHISDQGKIFPEPGTAASPSYSFNTDADSGMFSIGSNAVGFATGGAERFKINSNGLLLTGTSHLYINGQRTITNARSIENVVNYANTDGHMTLNRTGNAALIINRKGTTSSSKGEMINFKSQSAKVARIGYTQPFGGLMYITAGNTSGCGVGVYSSGATQGSFYPVTLSGGNLDNGLDLGTTSARWDDVYATNGTIQTSDRSEKQDIQALTDAETRVATACKGLIRRYRWISSVEEKGEDARYHFGAIAQDVEDAFTAEGLDAGDYALFIRTTWWAHEGHSYPSADVAPAGAVEKTRLGIRYNQLLAFIISAL